MLERHLEEACQLTPHTPLPASSCALQCIVIFGTTAMSGIHSHFHLHVDIQLTYSLCVTPKNINYQNISFFDLSPLTVHLAI